MVLSLKNGLLCPNSSKISYFPCLDDFEVQLNTQNESQYTCSFIQAFPLCVWIQMSKDCRREKAKKVKLGKLKLKFSFNGME